MGNSIDCQEAQELGVATLGELSFHDYEAKDTIAHLGGINCIVDAMDRLLMCLFVPSCCSMFDKTTGSLLHQGKSTNKPLWYGFWLQLPNLLKNLLFLRIEAFLGWSIMLFVDWLIWWLWPERKF